MVQTAADLQQLKGVGRILAKRLYDAGFDSFAKIGQAGEAGLKKVRGVSPRYLISIVEQARQLSESAHPGHVSAAEALQQRLSGVKGKLRTVAGDARERLGDKLEGKSGKQLSSDLIRIEDALQRMSEVGKKGAKRAGKALAKTEKRVAKLEGASLKKLHKGLKKARKAVLKVL